MKINGVFIIKSIFVLFLLSCNSKKDPSDTFVGSTVSKINISIKELKIDSFYLDSSSTSFDGTLHVYKNEILFVDNEFCWVFRFDKNGKFISRNIGQGDGTSELSCKRIASYVSLPNGEHMFFGPSWDVYIFDSNFKKISDYRIDWHPRANKEYMLTHPDPSDPIMYSVTHGLVKIRADQKNVYLPLFSQHNLFNPATDWYAKDARVLGCMNIQQGDVTEIYGRLSPAYQENKELRTFSYLFYDLIPDDQMIVTYPADSLIYLFTRDFSLIKKFGSAGRSMDTNYQSTGEYKKMKSTWVRENKQKGYYTSIDYISERSLLFRSYQKNETAPSDGLQIYNSDELIADVDIPKGCNIVGYISPFFYLSSRPDEASGHIKVYRFQLPL